MKLLYCIVAGYCVFVGLWCVGDMIANEKELLNIAAGVVHLSGAALAWCKLNDIEL